MGEFPDLSKYDFVAVDCETTGIGWWKEKVFAMSISTPDGKDFYWDFRDGSGALEWARREIPRAKNLIGHNIKFDLHFLREAGIVPGPGCKIHDTMIRAALLNEHEHSYSLDNLAKKYLHTAKVDIVPELGKIFGGLKTGNVQMPRLQYLGRTWPKKPEFDMVRDFDAERELAAKYAARDTRLTLDLFNWQTPKLIQEELDVVLAVEMDLFPILMRMERGGVRVDVAGAERVRDELKRAIVQKEMEFYKLYGFVPNVDAAIDIKKLFNPIQRKDGIWKTDAGETVPSTPTGAPSFAKGVLAQLVDPRAAQVIEMRNLKKLCGTFIEGHILSNHHDGRVHTSFNQTRTESEGGEFGTITGRMSSNNPNLQQIHKRNKELASMVRSLFLPNEGQVWSCRDWAQMDFRVFAHYVNDPSINARYAADPLLDFHGLVADITGVPRSPGKNGGANAKQINLAQVFGMGGGKLAQIMNLPFMEELSPDGKKTYLKPGPEAKGIIERYHAAIPGVRNLQNKAKSVAESRGYVKTALGRRIRFPERWMCYKAAGLLFQGSAADALKIKLIEVDRYLETTDGDLLLNVHDEFDASLPYDHEGVSKEIGSIVESFGPKDLIEFRVPIRSTEGVGPNWWEACKD